MTGGKWRFFGHGRRKWTSGGEPRGGMGAGKKMGPQHGTRSVRPPDGGLNGRSR
jgi:hypothetical protein